MEPNAEQLQHRRFQALELRLAGKSYRSIASALDVSVSTAFGDVLKALEPAEQAIDEAAEKVRRMDLARLDRLLGAIWERAIGGDDFAVDRVLKLMDRRAKLLGLDAPERHEVSTGNAIVLEVVGTEVRPAAKDEDATGVSVQPPTSAT